jgi:peptidoglycan/xylan/chitin deacetylase (PgdA/CDA1 family)
LRAPHGSHRPQVVLTFDDGYLDNYTEAYPVFLQEGVPATIFLVTDYVDGLGRFWWDRLDKRLVALKASTVRADGRVHRLDTAQAREKFRNYVSRRYCQLPTNPADSFIGSVLEQLPTSSDELEACPAVLSWPQIREMHANGIHFGSHTVTHPILSRAPVPRVREELTRSRDAIQQQLGRPVNLLAYPRGQRADVNARVQQLASCAGYSAAFSSIPGVLTTKSQRYMLPRVHVDTTDTSEVFALKVNGLWPLVTWLRAAMKPRC